MPVKSVFSLNYFDTAYRNVNNTLINLNKGEKNVSQRIYETPSQKFNNH